MSFDLSGTRVPIFTGINDTPVTPTATKAGNGSHLIRAHNRLADDVQDALDTLEEPILKVAKWRVVQPTGADYAVNSEPGQKIVAKTNPGYPLTVYLPYNPPVGSWLSFINTNPSVNIILASDFYFAGSYIVSASFSTIYTDVTLVFLGNDGGIGWIPSKPKDFFTLQFGSGS
jgi:hypothetical protein